MYLDQLEREIDRAMELSSRCRGEWCRSLECEVDGLSSRLAEVTEREAMGEADRIENMTGKIGKAYRNLAPDFRI